MVNLTKALMDVLVREDLESLQPKEMVDSCCRSYLTERGRCMHCPEPLLRMDDDDDDDDDDDGEEE